MSRASKFSRSLSMNHQISVFVCLSVRSCRNKKREVFRNLIMEECSVTAESADDIAAEAQFENHEQSEIIARRRLFPLDYKYVSTRKLVN